MPKKGKKGKGKGKKGYVNFYSIWVIFYDDFKKNPFQNKCQQY